MITFLAPFNGEILLKMGRFLSLFVRVGQSY